MITKLIENRKPIEVVNIADVRSHEYRAYVLKIEVRGARHTTAKVDARSVTRSGQWRRSLHECRRYRNECCIEQRHSEDRAECNTEKFIRELPVGHRWLYNVEVAVEALKLVRRVQRRVRDNTAAVNPRLCVR
jgi:hypothetical protein